MSIIFNTTKETQEEVSKLKELRDKLKECEIVPHKCTEDTPIGTVDFSQEEMALRNYILKTVALVFKKHGAETINTPVFELKEVFSDKYGEDSNLIYDLMDQGGEKLSLRYDLTIPFARYLAMNKKMTMICCQIAKVYRRDFPRPERGIYREFYQGEFNIVGSYDPMIPEAHCIWVMYDILRTLNLTTSIGIRINHRSLLDGILEICGVPAEKFRSVSYTLDRLGKMDTDLNKCVWPWEDVELELVENMGLKKDVVERIRGFVEKIGIMDLVEELLRNESLIKNRAAVAALEDVKLLLDYCQLLDMFHVVELDLGLTRNMDYYTGIIFEAVLEDDGLSRNTLLPVGSVAGGGRYDNLVGTFDSKGKSVPCVGFSIGIDRLYAALVYSKKVNGRLPKTNGSS